MAIVTVTTNNFDEQIKQAGQPVLVDFWAAWCGPCRMLSPVIDELSEQVTHVKFAKINIDEQQDLAVQFQVSSIPTLVLFQNGEPVKRLVGMQPKQAILDFLK